MTEGKRQVFVYGTLKQGMGNHRNYLGENSSGEVEYVGEAVTLSKYEMGGFGLGFPSVYEDTCLVDHQGHIVGELYLVDDAVMEDLDYLEGVAGGLYYRKEIIVQINQRLEYTEMYFRNRSVSPAIPQPDTMVPSNNTIVWAPLRAV